VGGLNPVGWQSTNDSSGSNAAFVWYSTTNGSSGGCGDGCVKCPILTSGNSALFDYATGGP
jgi:hypothetical protein